MDEMFAFSFTLCKLFIYDAVLISAAMNERSFDKKQHLEAKSVISRHEFESEWKTFQPTLA